MRWSRERHANTVTEDEAADIYLLTSVGCSLAQITQRAQVSTSAALWWATKLLDEGPMSDGEVARQLGVSTRTVQRYRARRRVAGDAA